MVGTLQPDYPHTMNSPSIILRQWRDEDIGPLAAMNADPEVMRFFPGLRTNMESNHFLTCCRSDIDARGWGFWAVEVDGEFAGLTGLNEPNFTAHFTPCIEIGWRFHRKFWGRSIAYASARAAESYAFQNLKLSELVTFTAAINLPSRRLMERLGFVRKETEDFQHPLLAMDSPIGPHVLYRKKNQPPTQTHRSELMARIICA